MIRSQVQGGVLLSVFILGMIPAIALPDPDSPELTPQQRADIIEEQEKRWQIDPEMKTPGAGTWPSEEQPNPFTGSLTPKQFTVDASRKNHLEYNGTILEIPENSFPGAGKVTVEILSLRTHADFLLAGQSTEAVIGGKHVLLNSTGMARFTFQDERGRRIFPVKPVVYKNQAIDSGNAGVYKMENQNWQQTADRAGEAYDEDCAPECPTVQFYEGPVTSGWWNFDVPNEKFTCITGRLDAPAGRPLLVMAAGITYFGVSKDYTGAGRIFRVNVLKNSDVKLVAVEQNRDQTAAARKTVLLGHLDPVRSSSETAFTKAAGAEKSSSGKCSDAGTIILKETGRNVLSDRKRLLEHINMPATD